jgi:hypothetical protein
VEVADASEVLPRSSIIYYRGRKDAVRLFANIFRIELLSRGTELWLDADVLLLKPIGTVDDYLYGWESDKRINNAVLKMPADCELLARLKTFVNERPVVCPWWPRWKQVLQRSLALVHLERGPETIALGTLGPKAVTHFVKELGLAGMAKQKAVFYPVKYDEKHLYFEPGGLESRITEITEAVHMWLSDADIAERILPLGKDHFLSDTMLGCEFARRGIELNVQ